MSQLEIENVTKVYDPKTNPVAAVKSLDLAIESGDVVALLGSSGCGKTSTLRMIAGFEDVTEGAIRVAGRDVARRAPAERRIAMAFEGYSLYPPMTVRENIGFALQSARVERSEIDRRVDEMARMLEIESVLERYPASISGGQQQRASLARALIREADLHLLDEPMGQLEPQLRALLRGRIKHYLKERGCTAILVTHDQTEANALADRIAVMEAGVLQQYASPAELRERPANLFTGTFIGEPPMNVIDAAPVLPYVSRLAEAVPTLDFRLLDRDDHLDLMDEHLTNGRSRSIPVVLLLDGNGQERAWWGPRPADLQAWVMSEGQELEKTERYKRARQWFARDKGRSTLEEIVAMMETAAGAGIG